MSEPKQSPPGGQEKAAAPAPAAGTKKKRLLLIEDENATRVVLMQKLRAAGFEVDVAPNGRVAIEKLRSSRPDGIFMDLLLPQVKGVDVIKEARRIKGFGNRPIYVCTSAANMEAWTKRGTKAGATKIYDRAVTAIDAIVAEIAADILGTGPVKESTDPQPQVDVKPEAAPEPAPQVKAPVAASGSPPPPPSKASSSAPAKASSPFAARTLPIAQVSPPPPSLIKRILKVVGLSKKDESPDPVETEDVADIATPVDVPEAPKVLKPAAVAARNQAQVATVTPVANPGQPSREAPTAQFFQAPMTGQGAAVITLDQAGKILSADEGAVAMFGWEAPMLVDVDLKVLLKEGLDQGIESFLHRYRGADASKGSGSAPLTARRRDGTEFRVSVTTLTWSSETTLTRKSDSARASWTAIFRDLTVAAKAPVQTAKAPQEETPIPAAQPMPPSEDLSRLQQSHSTLQKTNSELQQQLQELSAQAATQREALAQSQKEREEWEKRIRTKELELNLAQSASERAEQARKQLEQKLQELATANTQLTAAQQSSVESKRRGEELESRLRETMGDLECLKADAATSSEEKENLESALLEELNAAQKAAVQAEANLKRETLRNEELEKRLQILGNNLKQEQSERTKRFEKEMAALRKERDDLNGKLAAEQSAVAESRRRAEELEDRLRDNASEFARAKAELDKQTAERKRSEDEWRGQLENAKALTKTLEQACAEAVERNSRFESELALLQLQRDELQRKLVAEQHTAAEPRQRVEELEGRLRENAAELARVKSEAQQAGRDISADMELVSLEQVRDALSAKLTAEQWAASEASRRTDELEAQLRANSAELERVKADRDQQAEAHALMEADLRKQLDATKTAVEQVAAALTEKATKCTQLQTQMASIQQSRDELGKKLTSEQQAATESRQRTQELEGRMRESAGELERFKAEREKQAEQQARLDSELQAQLAEARAAAQQVEAGLKRESERCSRLEEELVNLQKERRQLRDKCDSAQQAETNSKLRIKELEDQLREREAGVASVKLELQNSAAERGRVEADLRAQLESAKNAVRQADAARQEQATQRGRLEEELARLRKGHEELGAKWKTEQRTVEDSKRRIAELEKTASERAAELQRAQASIESQSAERGRSESELRTQLEAAKGAAQKADAARQELSTQRGRLQEELKALQKSHEELGAKWKTEQNTVEESKRRIAELEKALRESATELQRAKGSFDNQTTDRAKVEADLRSQLEAAKAAARKAEATHQEQLAHRGRLEKELAGLRKKHDELGAKGKTDQKAVEDSRRRIAELEKAMSEKTTELQRTKTTFDNQAAERGRAESDLRAQLEAAKGAAQKAAAAQQELATQRGRLQEELNALRKSNDELGARWKTEQGAVEESRRRITELEKSSRESVAELQRAKAAFEKEAAERARQVPPPPKPSGNTEGLTKELCRLREEEAVRRAELSDLQRQLREGGGSSARAVAELEKERGERRRVEQRCAALTAQLQELHGELKQHLESAGANQKRITDIEQELREREDSVTRVNADLQKEAASRQLAEEQLRSTAELNGHLRNCLSSFELAKKGFKRMQEELESRQQANLSALKETEAKLQAEASERKRLEDALAAAQRDFEEQTQKSSFELAKLQSELEVEKFEQKRLQGEALQSRYSTLDSARVGQAMVNNFRKQIEQPVDHLMQSTRRLLESQLEGEQKKLVEALLEDALLLRTSLQDSGPSNVGGERGGSPGPTKSDAIRPPGLVPERGKPNLQP